MSVGRAQASLDEFIANANRKYGDDFIHVASDSLPVNRLPFLQPNLNRATEGGAPFGRFSALYGDPGSGKSRVALELIAQAQQLPRSAEVSLIPRIAYHSALADDADLGDDHRARHLAKAELLDGELCWLRREFPDGADALYVNAEVQFDKVWAQRIGVDLDRLMIMESVTIEEIMEGMQNLYAHIPVHVIDSTSNASSLVSQKLGVGQSPAFGGNAKQWKICLQDSMPFWDRERNLGVLIHQMSTNMKTGGQQVVATKYMTFLSRLSLSFTPGRFLYRKDGVLTDKAGAGIEGVGVPEADGREIFVRVEKSTTCRPFRRAGMQWDYGRTSFVAMHDLAMKALSSGLVVPGGGGWYRAAGEDGSIGQGLKSVYARIADDEDLRTRLQCMLLDHTADA